MTSPENVGRQPILDARTKLMQHLRGPKYDGQTLRNAFEEYETVVLDVIKDRSTAHMQISNMAKGLAVCARVRHDVASAAYFMVLHDQYASEKKQNPSDPQQ